MAEHMSIAERVVEAKGDDPFRFLGPDNMAEFEAPGRASMTLEDMAFLGICSGNPAHYLSGLRACLTPEDRKRLMDLKPTVAWCAGFYDAYLSHLGAQPGKRAGSSR